MHQHTYYALVLGWTLTFALHGQAPPPAAAPPPEAAPPGAAAAAKPEPSPLTKIRLTVTTQRRDADYRTADPLGDPSRAPKPKTTNADGTVTEAEESIKVSQDFVTVKVKVRNDSPVAGPGALVTVFYLGQMVKDAKLYRLLGTGRHKVDLPLKGEIEMRPLMFLGRSIAQRRYQRGTRPFTWVVTVRDAEGRLAAIEVPPGKDYLKDLLPTLEKAADQDAKPDHISFFDIAGNLIEANAKDLDFAPNLPPGK